MEATVRGKLAEIVQLFPRLGFAAWGDPVPNFIALPGWLGWECIPDLLAAYKLSLNDGLMTRLQFLGRVMMLE